MKKLLALVFCLATATAFAQGTKITNYPDGGNLTNGDATVIIRGGVTYHATPALASTTTAGLILCGSGLGCSTTAGASVAAVGPTGSPQLNNGGAFYGPPIPTAVPTATSSATNIGAINPQAEAAITSGLRIDPRGYGAKCTGWYGLNTAAVSVGGASFSVGDKFLAYDDNLSNMGGYIGVPATGHITAVTSGAATAVVLDTPGSGYNDFHSFNVIPLTGTGNHMMINASTLGFINDGPSAAPTVTLASAGGASSTPVAGYAHIAAGEYNVGDYFAIPNTPLNGNYLVGRVDSVTSTFGIATYHLYNIAGDYAISVSPVSAITITGTGSGATFNVTSATTAGGTFDDTYGLLVGQVASRVAGGTMELPDNCWVNTLPTINGAIIVGSNDAPVYGMGSFWHTGNVDTMGSRRAPILNVIGVPTTYVIDLAGTDGGVLRGFQILPHNQSFGGGAPFSTTIGIGSSTADPFATNGNGAGGIVPWFINRVAAHYLLCGFGTQGRTSDPFVFAKLHQNDWGANQNGLCGRLSDLVEEDDTIVSMFGSTTSAGGYCADLYGAGARIGPDNRCEFATGGWRFNNNAGFEGLIHGNQMTALTECAVYASGSSLITSTGNQFSAVATGGSLKITGAADNGSGLIRLTLASQFCGGSSSGSTTCDTPTGSIVNIRDVVGTVEANGNQQTVTNIDGTHLDIVGSTFSNAYVSGGTVAVNNKDAPLCVINTNGFVSSGDVNLGTGSNINQASAVMVDAVGSSNIIITGGLARKGTATTSNYTQDFGNFQNSTNARPAGLTIHEGGYPDFDNSVLPSISGLTLTSTGGSLNNGFAISNTTTSAGILTLGSLPPDPNGYNCQGGDATLGNNWSMAASATTSTSCGLNATTTVGGNIWFKGGQR